MNGKVSVVMAVYNGRMYIKEQLDSILKQSKQVDEIIVIEDCSNTPSKDIIDDVRTTTNCNIQYFVHAENKGYAQSFFEALKYASGDYIFLSDQDDIWHKDKVKLCIETMSNKPYITCMSSLNVLVDANGKEISRENKKKTKLYNISYKELVEQRALRPGMSLVITKALKNQIDKMDTSLFEAHDRLIEYLSVLENGFYWIQHYLTYYRIHNSNVSGMNFSLTRLRTNKQGRIKQIDFELRYLDQIKGLENSREDIIGNCIHYYEKRRELLLKGSIVKYVLGSFCILNMYSTYRIWFGDILSILRDSR